MAQGIDVEWLGIRLRRVREERNLTLKEVSEEIGITIPTLSRIERGGSKDIQSGTLLTLTEWLDSGAAKSKKKLMSHEKLAQETPDIVELHLRADKKLDKKT